MVKKNLIYPLIFIYSDIFAYLHVNNIYM
jgi:hypothetical protein